MTHKIAIITTGYESYDRYGDDYGLIVQSITDWDEVTDEDFKCLRTMEGILGYHVIERPADAATFIKKTVADYKAYVKAEEQRMADEKVKREKAALERKMKKELKDKKSKTELLAKLVAELGPDAVKSLQ
jgi:hypothetical protein